MEHISIALDWTPNVNHIGILIAKEKGFFHDRNISVDIIDPSSDHYSITPGKKLETGIADLAIAPFETVISLNNKENKVDAIAVYAILQEDLSCIVTLKESGLNRPADLAGKKYASYKARYEDHIVQAMLKNDGAQNEMICVYPEKLGIWNTLLTNAVDATWIFDNWEGVEASIQGISLNKFQLASYNIPYGYSPVILAKKHSLEQHPVLYKNVIAAIKKGYVFAVMHPEESGEILRKYLTTHDRSRIDVKIALHRTIPYFGNDDHFGQMNPDKVHMFLQWLVDHGLENEKILHQELFTNQYNVE